MSLEDAISYYYELYQRTQNPEYQQLFKWLKKLRNYEDMWRTMTNDNK